MKVTIIILILAATGVAAYFLFFRKAGSSSSETAPPMSPHGTVGRGTTGQDFGNPEAYPDPTFPKSSYMGGAPLPAPGTPEGTYQMMAKARAASFLTNPNLAFR